MKTRKHLFLILLSLITWVTVSAQENVLFIGNSFTYGSKPSVPELFDALARAAGEEDPITVMQAPGGKCYRFHSTNEESQQAITSRQWDYVIMQNFSTRPTHVGSVEEHLTYGMDLYQQIITNNPETQVILYETWSRSAIHEIISGTSSEKTFTSTTEMQDELQENYKLLAETLNATYPNNAKVLVAPCGTAWENAGALLSPDDPDYRKLHGNDEYHGNDDGYYLNALVFYCMIYGRSPVGLHTQEAIMELEELSLEEDPAELERIAWKTYRKARKAAKED